MPLIQYPQDRADAALVRLIAALQSTAWPADGAEQPFPTAPDTHATSFVLLEGGEAVCHVGVRRCAGEGLLLHAGRLPCGRHKAGAFSQRQPAPDNHADADFGKDEAPCGRF